MVSEKDYEKQNKAHEKSYSEFKKLAKRIEPYWNEKTGKLSDDAPDSIKSDYKRFLELYNTVMEK